MANDCQGSCQCSCVENKINENLLVIALQGTVGNQRAAELNIQTSILSANSVIAKAFGGAIAAGGMLPQQLGGLQTAAGTPGQGGG